MWNTTKKILKWAGLSLLLLLITGFLFVWFVLLAPPKPIQNFGEIKDAEWHTVVLGGKTICSDGSPFSILTRKGTSDNLIIHFSGGGACWDSATCAAPITLMSLFDGDSKQLKSFYVPSIFKGLSQLITGLLNNEDTSNPFKDWNVVYIPYCTGDMHIGNTINTYNNNGKKFTIHHNGRNNSLAALQWAFSNFKNPGKILVSGESAGAYASAFWAPAVATHYADKKIYQLSDGSLLASNRWNEIMDTVWKAESLSFLNFNIGNDIFEDALLKRNDSMNYRIKHLHSNTVFDKVLPRFSAVLNHTSVNNNDFIDNWSVNMRSSMSKLDSSGLDYEYFISDCQYNPKNHSTPHTLTGLDYHNCKAENISFPEWLKKNIIDDEPISVGKSFLDTIKK
jgi:hypothetical protein